MKHEGDVSVLWHFRRPILRVLGIMAGLFLAFFVVKLLMEVVLHPWARSFGLWPTLTGDWSGELITARGRTPVQVAIRSDFLWRSEMRHSPFIMGRLDWCDPSGTVRQFDISGDVENWRGTAFHLTLYRRDPAEPGTSPSELRGEWRGDAMEATGTLARHGSTATAEVTRGQRPTEDSHPARYVLRRNGGEAALPDACRAAPPSTDVTR